MQAMLSSFSYYNRPAYFAPSSYVRESTIDPQLDAIFQLDDVVMAKYRGDWQPCVIKSLRNYPKRVTVVGLDYEFYGIWAWEDVPELWVLTRTEFSLQPREPSNESAHFYCTANTRLAHGHGDGNGDGDGDDDETSSRFLDPLRSVARVVAWRAGGTLAVLILVASILRRLSQWI